MTVTNEQANTVRNMGLDGATPRQESTDTALVFDWPPGGIVIVTAHGSASIYPTDMLDHALAGIQ